MRPRRNTAAAGGDAGFLLGCRFSGQILSYNKMLGQLRDAGNTTTLAHYLGLLAGAGLMTGLSTFAGNVARRRGSSPKLQVLTTALMTATSSLSSASTRRDGELCGVASSRPRWARTY